MSAGPALHTDHYELTMLDAALGSGVASHRAVFEVFTRRLPPGRGYGVLAGTGRLATVLASFTFGSDDLAALEAQAQFSPRLLDHLSGLRVTGRIDGHRDGEIYMPNEPVLVVETSFGTGLLLETLVLSVLNHDSAVASAAARMHDAAGGRTLLEMGGRRTHEQAAVAAARAAWLVGFDATSNLAAGARHGVPTAGTAAHAFILAHPSEAAAFAAQMESMGAATTLLVDTYDIDDAIDDAVAVAEQLGSSPGGIRIDSGDLAEEAVRARARLDTRGAGSTRIVVSGDLDEYRIAELRRGAGGRVRRRHRARHRIGPSHGGLRLQAGRRGAPPRAGRPARARLQDLRGQADAGRARPPPPDARRTDGRCGTCWRPIRSHLPAGGRCTSR